jgi:hypothetical protein
MAKKNPLETGGEYPQVTTKGLSKTSKSDSNLDLHKDKKFIDFESVSDDDLRKIIRELVLQELGTNSPYGSYYYKYTSPYPKSSYKSREEFLKKAKEKGEEEVPSLKRESDSPSSDTAKLIQMANNHDRNELRLGLRIEKEHDDGGILDTVGDSMDLLKIVLAHLEEDPKYYSNMKDSHE